MCGRFATSMVECRVVHMVECGIPYACVTCSLLSCRMTTVEDGAWEHLAVVYKYLPKAANVDSIKAVGSAGAQLKVPCLDFTRSVFARHALSTCVGYMH